MRHIPDKDENASGVSADPQVQGLVDQSHDITRRDSLTLAAPLPEAVSPGEPLSGAAEGPLSEGASPPIEGVASPQTGGFLPAPVLAKRE